MKPNLITGDLDGENAKRCSKPCNSIKASYGYPWIYKSTNSSSSSITLYFTFLIPIRESHLAYDGSSLFAEIGGYTGLLLGFSLYDFAKLFSFLVEKAQTLNRISSIIHQSE